MGSITAWTRLEPVTGGMDVGAAAAARLYDPLWLLARQWQVGEFQGEDGGSPVVARWRGQVGPMRRRWFGPIPPNTQVSAPPFDPDEIPLECLVERQPLPDNGFGASGLRDAVEYGAQFLRILADQPTANDYTDAFRNRYAVVALTPDERLGLDTGSREYADLVAGRALDGRRLRADLGTGPEPGIDASLGVATGDLAEVREACTRWIAWVDGLVSQPSGPVAGAGAGTAWQPDRLEYAFSLAQRLAGDEFGERTLTADQYADGTLDWYSFDLNGEVATGTAADQPAPVLTRTVIPTPVTYPGMPAARFWEFEDARIDLGALQPGAADLAQLLTLESIGGFGNDWFLLPIELPVGSLVQSRSLVVTDTFGVRTLHRPNGDVAIDDERGDWQMYQFAMPVEPGAAFGVPITNLFYLPPTLVQPLEGEPLEEVLLVRDEMANMAWAIERRLESPLGEGVDVLTTSLEPQPTDPRPTRESPRYRLASAVPAHWVPLLPTRVSDTEVRLARAATLGSDGPVEAQARVLRDPFDPGRRLLLAEEEVPREGALVRRAYQAARSPDGRLHVWIGHRTTVGRGEGSSGLRFDTLVD